MFQRRRRRYESSFTDAVSAHVLGYPRHLPATVPWHRGWLGGGRGRVNNAWGPAWQPAQGCIPEADSRRRLAIWCVYPSLPDRGAWHTALQYRGAVTNNRLQRVRRSQPHSRLRFWYRLPFIIVPSRYGLHG